MKQFSIHILQLGNVTTTVALRAGRFVGRAGTTRHMGEGSLSNPRGRTDPA